MPLSDGQHFAGYTVQRLLGAGGMGEVYLVQHPRLPRLDALKILPAHLTADDDYRARFHREADLAAALWNPHIVGVHDRGEHDGQLWISMDFVDGTDAARLLRGGPAGLAVADVLDIVDAVADALDFAHHGGLLHRDVKPANILVATPPTGRKRILLADFGIARFADDVQGLTATNTTLGTVSYAAPEQLLGETLTGSADQYALAATAYHLLKGAPPFSDSNPAVVIGQHLNAAPPSLGSNRPELAPLDPVFARALAKRPDQRFGNCLDFAIALRAAATPPSDSAPTTRWAWVPPTGETVATYPGGHAVLPNAANEYAFGQQPTQWRPLPPPGPPPPNAPATKRSRVTALAVPIVLVILLAVAGTFAAVTTSRANRHASAPPRWAPFVDAGRQTAINLTSINVATVDADVQRVLDGTTGSFHTDFAQRAQAFTQTVRDAKSVSVGTVTEAGLEDVDANRAHVLVAITVTTTMPDQSAEAPRAWRMRISIVDDGGTYTADNVEFVS